jgi:hypothetical protein
MVHEQQVESGNRLTLHGADPTRSARPSLHGITQYPA